MNGDGSHFGRADLWKLMSESNACIHVLEIQDKVNIFAAQLTCKWAVGIMDKAPQIQLPLAT